MLLLTAFNPFGQLTHNASEQVLTAFLAQTALGSSVHGVVLPTEFVAARTHMQELVARLKPEAIVMLGVAEGRSAINLEHFALNIQDARMPDNAGFKPRHCPVEAEGPPAFRSSLPLELWCNLLNDEGIPCEHSYEAGTYVCNHLFYSTHFDLASQALTIPAGFVHLPPLEMLPLEIQVKALNLMLPSLSIK